MNSPTPSPDSTDSSSPASESETPKSLAGIKPKFSLGPTVIALIAITCAWRIYVVLQGLKVDQDMLWVSTVSGRAVGTIIGVVFISAGPAWLVWLVSRRRKTFAIATCVIMLGLINLATVKLSVRQANDKAWDEFDGVMAVEGEQQADILERALDGEEVMSEAVDRLDQTSTRLEQYGSESSGEQAQVAVVIAKAMRQIEEPLKNYVAAYNRFNDAGGIDPKTMADRAVISERLQMLNDFAEANERLATASVSVQPELHKQLNALNLDEEFVSEFIKGFLESSRPDIQSQIRQADRDLIESFRGIINTLDDAHGQWSVTDDGLIFEDNLAINKYNGYYERMITAATRQTELQHQYQEAIKNLDPLP